MLVPDSLNAALHTHMHTQSVTCNKYNVISKWQVCSGHSILHNDDAVMVTILSDQSVVCSFFMLSSGIASAHLDLNRWCQKIVPPTRYCPRPSPNGNLFQRDSHSIHAVSAIKSCFSKADFWRMIGLYRALTTTPLNIFHMNQAFLFKISTQPHQCSRLSGHESKRETVREKKLVWDQLFVMALSHKRM